MNNFFRWNGALINVKGTAEFLVTAAPLFKKDVKGRKEGCRFFYRVFACGKMGAKKK